MIQHIVDGISEKLHDTFGGEYRIYTESVKQGLKEPCFFIQLINPVSRRELGKRFFRENLFCIQYFPQSREEPKAECYEVQDRLFLGLDTIRVDGDLVRGINMHGELANGILSFFVNFNLYVLLTEESVPMEKLILTDLITKG